MNLSQNQHLLGHTSVVLSGSKHLIHFEENAEVATKVWAKYGELMPIKVVESGSFVESCNDMGIYAMHPTIVIALPTTMLDWTPYQFFLYIV